jgi:hypothetical protein
MFKLTSIQNTPEQDKDDPRYKSQGVKRCRDGEYTDPKRHLGKKDRCYPIDETLAWSFFLRENAFCSPGRLTFHPSDSPEIDLSLCERIPLHLARSIDLGARVGRSGPCCMSFFGLEGRHLWLEAEVVVVVPNRKYELLYLCVYLVAMLLPCCCQR